MTKQEVVDAANKLYSMLNDIEEAVNTLRLSIKHAIKTSEELPFELTDFDDESDEE